MRPLTIKEVLEIKKEVGLSATAISVATGISGFYLSQWETRARKPRQDQIDDIARAILNHVDASIIVTTDLRVRKLAGRL